MIIQRTNTNFQIMFQYSPYLVEAVKRLPNRRWDGEQKCWIAPIQDESIISAFAQRYGFRFSKQEVEDEKVMEIPPMPELNVDLKLVIEPYPYQKQGIAYSLDKKKVLIGDKPGLGKTLQAIATVNHANAYPCVVVCPSSLKINWQREFKKFTGKDRAMILEDSVKKTWPLFFEAGMADVYIVNYESLRKYFVERITEHKKLTLKNIIFKDSINIFKSIIIDESHRAKNGSTQQAKFCMGLASGKDYRILLSGTPVINKPMDLVAQLHILGQLEAFGGYKGFVNRYCAGPRQASNLKELNYMLNKHCFFQREKKDVLKDLPAKVRQTIICEISNRQEYSNAEADLVRYLREYKQASDESIQKSMRGEVMVRINILRQISARGKVKEVSEHVADLIEQGEKVILFVNLHEVVAELKKNFPKAVTVTGMDKSDERQRAVDSFQTDSSVKLIICSIKAAGVGLTLTASSNVRFVEFPWTYADCEQCEDRAHRIGQLDSVTAGYFLGKNTIDEKIYQIIQTKKDMANTITGSTEQVEEDTINLIANLFTK